jgi:hypothetical protein
LPESVSIALCTHITIDYERKCPFHLKFAVSTVLSRKSISIRDNYTVLIYQLLSISTLISLRCQPPSQQSHHPCRSCQRLIAIAHCLTIILIETLRLFPYDLHYCTLCMLSKLGIKSHKRHHLIIVVPNRRVCTQALTMCQTLVFHILLQGVVSSSRWMVNAGKDGGSLALFSQFWEIFGSSYSSPS